MAQVLVMATRGKVTLATEEKSYMAGIVDSDGCISIGKMRGRYNKTQRIVNPRYVLQLVVTNCSVDLMNWLTKKFYGRIHHRKSKNPNTKQCYNWMQDHGKALHTLRMIRPYLIVKDRQADIGIELIEKWVTTIGGQGAFTPPEEVDRRESLYQAMKILNHRGKDHPQRLSPTAPVWLQGKR